MAVRVGAYQREIGPELGRWELVKNAQVKVPCLVAGMIAKADSIDDRDVLRQGRCTSCSAGSGSRPHWDHFPRMFTWGTCSNGGR
jgi:hypothetical protein